jgi:type IV secretion system protein VirD4
MTGAAVVELKAGSAAASPWAVNGGIYFGHRTAEPAKPERPLEGKEAVASVPADVRPKTTWQYAPGEHRYSSDRHVVTIGPNGSGKTRKLLLPNLYRVRDWSCVVIDPKGELAAHTAVFRASRPGHRVIVLDPFAVLEQNYPRLFERYPAILRSGGFNPIAALDPSKSTFIDDARSLAIALIKTEETRDPYWPMAAQALVKGLLMGLRLRFGDSASLGALRDTLGLAASELAGVNKTLVNDYGEAWPALAASLNQFTVYTPEDKELNAIVRTALVQTEWLDSPQVQADLERGAFDFASLKQAPTTVYLVLPPQFLVSHGVWLRLMVTSILMPLLRSVERAPVPVLFMLDEFAQLGHMQFVQNNYALMRGFGVKLWTIWQDLTQAKRLYHDQWESFISNAGIVQTFAPQDVTTREYLSRFSGERIIWHDKTSTSDNVAMKGGTSFGSSQTQVNIQEAVFKPHELAALDEDEAVIFFRRGQYRLSILPQPEMLTDPTPGDAVSVADRLREARAEIEGLNGG